MCVNTIKVEEMKQYPTNNIAYDIFLSAPMSAFSNKDAYKESRDQVIDIIKHIETNFHLSDIFYAGQFLDCNDVFDSADNALEIDVAAIKQASMFLMIYPEKVVSSALVEAGCALALNKPCLFLVRNREDLPYILKGADNSSKYGDIPPVLICEFNSTNDIFELIDKHLPLLIAT